MNEGNFRPDFIGIGANKSGTTWVADMLQQHPEICLSEPKEVRYFNKVGAFKAENPSFNKEMNLSLIHI